MFGGPSPCYSEKGQMAASSECKEVQIKPYPAGTESD